jgi:hypothetical protein
VIVAMGGGGFSMEPENPLLDDFVLSLTGKEKPRVRLRAHGERGFRWLHAPIR